MRNKHHMGKVKAWDVLVSKSWYKAIVEVVTKDRVFTTSWNGSIKAPERLSFSKNDIELGFEKMERVFEGNKFEVKLDKILEDFKLEDKALIEGYGKPTEPLTKDNREAWMLVRLVEDSRFRKLFCVFGYANKTTLALWGDYSDWKDAKQDNDPYFFRTLWDYNYEIIHSPVSLRDIANKYDVPLEHMKIV